ncbi:SpoIIE family protein phosphatase [Desulfopila aestuarii]|uniref:Sigma-B regulation protein RsbU (Phosphoserine phosphatase) n=1 Tax=Desulfopila aestuarii DSM 18488 TaxID=1121416 RepID=A0A1M7YFF4_9BACT|nr:SpoIIE family protein phosphatase [Desulfopila aestuarii]SHO51316.1 sigma-B regulation protein RsbU (phosphoserine phosphatase) [Desulfopila aestuarii DSM 18488]
MLSDQEKTREELLAEVASLRKRLANAELELFSFEKQCEERNRDLARECAEHRKAVQALEMSRLIVERSPVILFRRIAGENPHLEYISENVRQFGYSPEDFFSGAIHFKDVVHPDDQVRVGEEIRRYAKEDVEEYTMHYRCITKDGDVRWIEDQTSVIRDADGCKTHNQGVLFDITDRRLAEEALRKSEEKYRRIVETAAEGFVLMNEDLIIVDVNDAYCRNTGYSREELIGTSSFDRGTEEFREFMLQNRDTLLNQEYREFEGEGYGKDGRRIPFLVHGNTLRNDQGEIIGHMAFITDMTEHKKALRLAGEVQKSLLPQEKPQVRGLDIAGRNVSCDEIGGDYFDFIWQRDSHQGPFNVVVGDISGHGVDSALLMTTARAFLRMRASQPGTISEIISAMNSQLARDVLDSGRFMTLFYLSIDPEHRRLDWVRAGHDPALLYDPVQDEFTELKGEGIALGVVDEVNYHEHRREHLANGQIIAIGTDGIWEAFNIQGEMYGKNRLRECIRANAMRSAAEILGAVYEELRRFTLGRKTEDDITLVVIKVDGLEP